MQRIAATAHGRTDGGLLLTVSRPVFPVAVTEISVAVTGFSVAVTGFSVSRPVFTATDPAPAHSSGRVPIIINVSFAAWTAIGVGRQGTLSSSRHGSANVSSHSIPTFAPSGQSVFQASPVANGLGKHLSIRQRQSGRRQPATGRPGTKRRNSTAVPILVDSTTISVSESPVPCERRGACFSCREKK